MTDSQIENLLRQMALAEPSAELDGRVESCLRASEAVCGPASRRVGSWGVLSVVAAACLVIGVFVGHTMGAAFAVSDSDLQEDGPPVSDANRSGETFDVDRNDDANEIVVTVDWTSDLVRSSQMRGPRVAMLCAMGGKKLAAANEQQCLRCHDGITVAESDFRRDHMHSPGFETCMWCHDTSERREIRN